MRHTIFKSALIVIACGVCVIAFAQQSRVPTIRITTHNNQPPSSRTDPGCTAGGGGNWWWGGGGMAINVSDYIHMTSFQLEIPDNPSLNVTRNAPDSIRRRGNSTMTQSKIPFRVKFDTRTSLFGRERVRSWPLLANHYDNTQMLNAIAFELGRRMGLEFTPTFQFVDLFLNGEHRGIYLMTDQVQVSRNCVNIDPDFGWLVEFDFHSPASNKCLTYFTTSQYGLTTFIKSPEDLTDSTGYRFVKRDINRLVDSMASNRFPENGYRDLVDLQSYVTYVMIQQLMDNHDFNSQSQTGGVPGSNFAHKDVGGKIKAGPLWDFDLSAGITFSGGFTPQHFTTYQRNIMPLHPFYQRFFDDPVFRARWKKTWDRHQADIQTIPAFIDSLANFLAPRIVANFSSNSNNSGNTGGWPPPPPTNPIQTEQQYRDRIQTLKTWWTNRVQNFAHQIDTMNIDISKDIDDNPVSSITQRSKFINGSSVAAAKNGINLSVVDKATVKIFRLDGREVRTVKLTKGTHSLRFNDLPKGMYMVRVSIDGEKKALRTIIR